MRFRKRPKTVEAERVCDLIFSLANGQGVPHWAIDAVHAGKLVFGVNTIAIQVGQTCKVVGKDDWIAYDTEQRQVYYVSAKTMGNDYERVPS